jgi:hypothetical protein
MAVHAAHASSGVQLRIGRDRRAILQRVGTERIVHLEQDAYYRDLSHLTMDERRKFNFDHPDAFEIGIEPMSRDV